jgi:hypothetical protein
MSAGVGWQSFEAEKRKLWEDVRDRLHPGTNLPAFDVAVAGVGGLEFKQDVWESV